MSNMMMLAIASSVRTRLPAPSFVNWYTMIPDDPTDYHTIFRISADYQAGDLILVTETNSQGPNNSVSSCPVSGGTGLTWATSSNSRYRNQTGWNNNGFVLWYAVATATESAQAIIADGSNDALYPESGGCGLYIFRPPPGKLFALDSAGNQAAAMAAYGTTGSLTLPATAGPGLIFVRSFGDEDNPNPVFGTDIATAIGNTNSQQSWTTSNTDTAGWAGYLFTSAAQENLTCNFTQSPITHIGMALDSFVLVDA